MTKGQIIGKLREHEAELKAAGVAHLRLFGSTARGESSSASDIDIMVDFEVSTRLTLVSLGHLQSRLTDLLGKNVDLSSADWMYDPVRTQALREAEVAF